MRNFVESVESRTFLSVTPTIWHHIPNPPDAAITADLNAIKAAQAALAAQLKTDGPTLKADATALGAAYKTARAAVPAALTTKLTTDETTAHTDLSKLFADYKAKAPAATITADKAAVDAAFTLVHADAKAIETSIDTNAGVVAAKAKLTADSAKVTADEKAVQAAYTKLFTDLKNHA